MKYPIPGTYLILEGVGVTPTLPPAGVRIREDVLFNPDVHLLPGSWAYNRTDRKWYYATDYGIQDITDQMGYVDPTPIAPGTYEAALGNPAIDGYILSSSASGVRTWIPTPSGGAASDHSTLTNLQGGTAGEYYHLAANLYNAFQYVPNSGSPYLRILLPIACDYDVQAYSDFSQFPPTIWESMPAASTSALGGIQLGIGSTKFLREDGTWQEVTVGGITNETDPIFTASAAFGISSANISNWTSAYSWGNHAGLYEPIIAKSTGYLKYTGSAWSFVNETYSLSDHTHAGMVDYTGTPVDNQLAVFTGPNTIEGVAGLAYDGSILSVEGSISQSTVRILSGTDNAFIYNSTDQNVRIGKNAGNNTMTQTYPHVLIGSSAGYNLGASNGNVFIGYLTGQSCGTGSYNVGVGIYSLNKVTTGVQNMAMGAQSLRNATGTGNTAIGYAAGMGSPGLSTGNYNVFIGSSAGAGYTTASANICLGYASGTRITTNSNNSYIGPYAGQYNTGAYNLGIGNSALKGVDGASTGGYNTAIGQFAGANITTGQYNLLIGYHVDPSSVSATYEFRLGYDTTFLLEGYMASGSQWIGSQYPFKVDTISEYTSGNGVNIDGLLIKDGSVRTTNFTITEESGKLVIKYGSTIVFSISTAGLLTAANDVVAFGTP